MGAPSYALDAHHLLHGRDGVTRRSQIIALQAAVVGVLLVVIYATILRPNDDSAVSGVNAPGKTPSPVVTKPSHPPRHHVNPRQPRNRVAQRRAVRVSAAAPSAGGAPTDLAPAAPGSTPVGGNSPGGGPGGESPTDDQYDDMLARLNAALR